MEQYTDSISQAWDAALSNPDVPLSFVYASKVIEASERLGKTSGMHGNTHSRRSAPTGLAKMGHRQFDPAYPQNLDITATLSNRMPLNYNFINRSAPETLHIGLDLPKRLQNNSGKYDLRKVGLFTTLLTCGIANLSGSLVELTINSENIKKYPKVPAIHAAKVAIAAVLNNEDLITPRFTNRHTTQDIIETVASSVSRSNDAELFITDLLDGYDSRSHDFSWQDKLRSEHYRLGDRLLVVRLESPAQEGLLPGRDKRLSARAAQDITRNNREFVKELRSSQDIALQGMRQITINGYAHKQHPVPALTDFFTRLK